MPGKQGRWLGSGLRSGLKIGLGGLLRLDARSVAIGGLMILAGLVTGFSTHAVRASALQVSPIRVELSAAHPAAALRLSNHGDTALMAQVRVFDWTQSPDHDRLVRTARLVASPPMVRIAAGDHKTVRIIRVDPAGVVGEEDYRVVVDELPDPMSENHDGDDSGVKMQLRYSVPVFVQAKRRGSAGGISFKLEADGVATVSDSASASQSASGANSKQGGRGLKLSVENKSSRYAQLSHVSIEWPDHRVTTVSDGLLGYALPGARRRWPIAKPYPMIKIGDQAGHQATLRLNLNGQPTTASLEIIEQAPVTVDRAN
jgi:fimbrial chaperone protein